MNVASKKVSASTNSVDALFVLTCTFKKKKKVERTFNIKPTLLTLFLGCTTSTVNYRYVQQMSRIYSSCITATLYL